MPSMYENLVTASISSGRNAASSYVCKQCARVSRISARVQPNCFTKHSGLALCESVKLAVLWGGKSKITKAVTRAGMQGAPLLRLMITSELAP
jgi:hypothetical protein